MQSGIRGLIRLFGRSLLTLLLVAFIVIAAQGVQTQWHRLGAIRADAEALAKSLDDLRLHRLDATKSTTAGIRSLSAAPTAAIDERISVLEKSLRQAEAAKSEGLIDAAWNENGLAHSLSNWAVRQIGVELQSQELAYLQGLRAYSTGALAHRSALIRLESLRRQHQVAYARLQENVRLIEALGPLDRLRYERSWSHNPRLASLSIINRQLIMLNQQAARAYAAQLAALSTIDRISRAPQFVIDHAPLDKVEAKMADGLRNAQSQLSEHWMQKTAWLLWEALPLAAGILFGSIAAHFLVKSTFYFVLAPLATRSNPIIVVPGVSGRVSGRRSDSFAKIAGNMPRSKVSQTITLGTDEHMLVLPDCILSTMPATLKDTKWLLDWSRPATSLLAGMFSLTRLRPTAPGQQVVLSSGSDPLVELSLVELDAGAAIVLYPRTLVGVLFPGARKLRITSHWRIASLHSFLTFQWRYLVFYGPVTLAIRGTRGVHVEKADGTRSVASSATLGFSANVQYGTLRTEPFFPYYRGQASLLQDVFNGTDGYYIVDESVANSASPRGNRRGLEGVTDALLRIVGI